MAALLSVGGAYALASYDWCGRWDSAPPELLEAAWGKGPLKAGSARVELEPPWPVTVAGYGPPRSTAGRANHPIAAQALVLEAGGLSLGVVGLDLLEVPRTLVERIRSDSGQPHLLVFATHAHSSMGGFDPRPLAQLAGVGRYDEADAKAVVRAAVEAVQKARARLAPAQLAEAHGSADMCWARSGVGCDQRMDRFVVTGLDGAAVGELWVVGAHPTLLPRRLETIDPDFPGLVALDRLDAGVTLVAQGAAGNARAGEETAPPFASRLEKVMAGLPLPAPAPEVALGLARVRVTLPHPDGSRLVPSISRAMATNFVCLSAEREAEVWAVALQGRTLLALPVEPSYVAGQALEEAAGADRTLSLADGYLGYLEKPEDAEARLGESKRQYYLPSMFEALRQGAALAGTTVRAAQR